MMKCKLLEDKSLIELENSVNRFVENFDSNKNLTVNTTIGQAVDSQGQLNNQYISTILYDDEQLVYNRVHQHSIKR